MAKPRVGRAALLEGRGQQTLGFSVEEMTRVPRSEWHPPDMSNLPDRLAGVIGVDLETEDRGLATGVGPGWAWLGGGHVAGYAVAADNFRGYFPVGHAGEGNLDGDAVRRWLNHALSDERQTKVYANAMYDVSWAAVDGVIIRGPIVDVQLVEALLDEHRREYALDAIAVDRVGRGKDERLLREAAAAYGVDPKAGIHLMPPWYVGPYAEEDAELPREIWKIQEPLITAEDLGRVLALEHALLPMYIDMRRRGVRIDQSYAEKLRDDLAGQMAELVAEVRRATGLGISIWESRSIAQLLDAEGVPYGRTEKRGEPQITNDVLEKGTRATKLVAMAREKDKLRGTFIEGQILGQLHAGRVHGQVHPLKSDDGGTVTGRLSMSSPNLQFIPKRTAEGKKVRRAFLPEDGEEWASPDFCFDDSTEVLTDRGFVLFKNLGKTDKVAQYRHDGAVSFVRPRAYQRVRFKGHLVTIGGGAHCRGVDLAVTPSHRCFLVDYHTGAWAWFRAEDYSQTRYISHTAINAGMFNKNGGDEVNLDEITLACAIQADSSDRGTAFHFYLKKPRKVRRLNGVLRRLHLGKMRPAAPSKPGFYSVSVSKKRLPVGVRELLDTKSFSRRILNLSVPCREHFLREIMLWDGTKKNHVYCSYDQKSAEIVQEVSVLTGHRSNMSCQIQTGRKTAYLISVSPRDRTIMKTVKKGVIPYNGWVYCVTMPASTVMVRRNGRVSVTGQSQQEVRLLVHYAILSKMPSARVARDQYVADPSLNFHKFVAQITGLDYDPAKILDLAIIYGRGVKETAAELGKSYEETKGLFDQHAEKLPFARSMSYRCQDAVNKRGYVKSLSGRRMRFPFFEPKNWDLRDGRMLTWERARQVWPNQQLTRARIHKSLNSLIQPSGADQTKQAMLAVWEAGLGRHVMIQVHDELPSSVPDRRTADQIAKVMRDAVKLEVPVKVDVKVGKNWGEVE